MAMPDDAKEAFLQVIDQIARDPSIGERIDVDDLPDDIKAAFDEPIAPEAQA